MEVGQNDSNVYGFPYGITEMPIAEETIIGGVMIVLLIYMVVNSR